MRTSFLGLALLLLASAACSKPCAELDGPLPTSWSAHPDLIAPGGTLCSVRARPAMARADYEHDGNPFVQVVQHLESQGWERTTQNITDQSSMSVSFRRGSEALSVNILANGKYDQVTYVAQ